MFRTFRLSVPDAARALRRIARPYLWSRQVPAGSGAARLVPGMPEPSVRTTRRFPSSASSSPGNCGQRAHIAEPSRLEKLPAPSRARVCERLSPALPFSFRTALRSPVPFGSLRTALCRVSRFGPYCMCGTGLCRAECSRRAVSQRPGRAGVLPCCTLHTVQALRTRAESSRPAPFAPRRVMPFGSLRTALCRVSRFGPYCMCGTGLCRAECSRRAVSQRPGRAGVLPCCTLHTVQALRTRAESSRPAPFAPRRVMPFGSLRTALCRVSRFGPYCMCGTGLCRAECSRRAVSQRPGRAGVLPCCTLHTVQALRTRAESSRPVPFAPRRSAGYGVSRRREILPAAPPFSDGDCGEDRSDEPKPKPSAPPRSNSQRDPRRQPFRCRRRKRGVPKAARGAVGSRPLPPFLPVVGASDSLLSAAGTARSPVRRHSPNRRR